MSTSAKEILQFLRTSIRFLSRIFSLLKKLKGDIYDSFHTVFVYLLNTACNDLPSNTTTQRYDESSQPPYGPVYMLKNSVISINICASTRNSDNDPLILYILKTVENFLNFDPKHPSKEYYRKHILVGNNGYTNCATISLTISTDDYYTIYFSPPKGVTLHYNITMTIRQIEVDAVNNSTLLGVFKPSNGDQTLKDGIKFQSGRYCLFADIQKSSNATSQDYTTLEVETGPRVNAGAGITATVLIVFLVVVMLSEVLIYFSVRKLISCHKRRGYTPMNINDGN